MLLKGNKIFIVEDNMGNLAIATFYLEQHGGAKTFSDRWVKRTPEIILGRLPIDVILMDLMFPNNVSGFDVFAQIKAVPALAHIPIVAVSASDPDRAVPRAMAAGFAGFISKPISDLISRQVADIIAGKRVWDV